MIVVTLGVLCCIAWAYLLIARGGFWRAGPVDDPATTANDVAWPHVVVIVPARDEADVIGSSVASLVAQRYAGKLTLLVVDDASSDATAQVARDAAAVHDAHRHFALVAATPTPPGWTGKLWALQCGVESARSLADAADYVLFTDADIVHDADVIAGLVVRAVTQRLSLVSLMATLRCSSFVERALVPAFVFFFQLLYPFAWVNRPERRTAAAAGGCMLVHRATLECAGGVAAVRDALIDDCALAALLKRCGAIRLAMSRRVRSVRAYVSIGDMRATIVRSAYAQLRFSPPLLALTLLGMAVTYIAPPLLALFGSGVARGLGALAWLSMALAFQPTLRFYRVSPLWGLALPAIAAAYLVFTLDSAYQFARGRAGLWKGRVYAAPGSSQ